MREIKIGVNDDNQTVIKYLNKYMSKAPNSLLYKWIRKKKIKVNKSRIEPSTTMYKGDILYLYIYDEEIEKWQEEKKSVKARINLDIAFENNDVMIIDKPQNVLVHAANPKNYGKNVVDFIVDLMIEREEYIPRLNPTFRPAIINRIDRNTMGLVIGAKNRKSLLRLNDAIDNGMIRKYYLTIVEGKLDKNLTIKNRLAKDENNHVSVSEYGKEAITKVNPILSTEKYSLVEVEILTGRTHQIRVSLADIGHPIIGDRRYSDDKNNLYKDQQLVAYKLIFDENISIKSLKNKVITSKYEKYIKDLFTKLI